MTQTQDHDWTGADDLIPADPAGTGSVCTEHVWQAACSSYRDERGYLVDAGERWCRVVQRDSGILHLQQGKLPLPRSGADADARADVSWPLWQDGAHLVAAELLSLTAKLGSGSVGPFPEEPLVGTPEAIERAAKTIRGTQLRCWRCGQLASTRVPEDTVVRGTLECPECSSAVMGAFERENSQLREQLDERIRRHEADARDVGKLGLTLAEETADASKAWALVERLAERLAETLATLHRCDSPADINPDDFLPGTITARALDALHAAGRLP